MYSEYGEGRAAVDHVTIFSLDLAGKLNLHVGRVRPSFTLNRAGQLNLSIGHVTSCHAASDFLLNVAGITGFVDRSRDTKSCDVIFPAKINGKLNRCWAHVTSTFPLNLAWKLKSCGVTGDGSM